MPGTIKPFILASVTLFLTILLAVTDIYYDDTTTAWTVILWIFLFAAILIMLWQFIQTEKEIKNYSAQLSANKERLNNEIKHRLWAEKSTAEAKVKAQIIDENIPVLLAYFNPDLRCRYHNRIFRRWFGLKPEQIDGRLLEEFANKTFASSIKTQIDNILSGKTIHEERILKSTKGFPYIFTEQFIPHLDSKGNAIGFYTLHTPCAHDKKRISLRKAPLMKNDPTDSACPESEKPVEKKKTVNAATQSGISSERIVQAIKDQEFKLYCQKIIPLDANSLAPAHYEILIRMAEEENNLMPPGSFLPLVDQLRMMPQLDRWVTHYLIQWLAENGQENRSVFCINVAKDTLCDKTFIEFVEDKVKKSTIQAHFICFEIEESDVKSNLVETMFFVEKIRALGCLVTLCGFGESVASIDLLKKIKIDHLKIDGCIVCNILYDEDDLTRLKEINQIARQLNINTIAELVENNETITLLQNIGIHYAQGLGVAKPVLLDDLYTDEQETVSQDV